MLYDNRIPSEVATFALGTPYHFTMVNAGSIDHERMVMPQVMGTGRAALSMD